MLPYQRRIFNITKTEIFTSTPKFRREWQIKANIIHQTHLKRMNAPAIHRPKRMFVQQWLQDVPRPTRIIPYKPPQAPKICKQQHIIKQ